MILSIKEEDAEISPSVTVYLGLGSNLGDPHSQLRNAFTALAALPHCRLQQTSGLYRSPALRGPGVPEQPDYLNAVAVLHTTLSPLALLEHVQAIETRHGRVRTGVRWGPRTLDVDILLYGNRQLDLPQLKIPHPQMAQRAFVLYPLYECAPQLCLPDGRCLAELKAACPAEGLQRVADG